MRTRQEKFPDNKWFKFYNINPYGKYTTDCVTRALALATGFSYDEVVKRLAQIQIETGYDSGDKKAIELFLDENMFTKKKQPRKYDNTKFTGREFVEKLVDKEKSYVIMIGGHHVSCVYEGRIHDTWDCSRGCVGNYWSIDI